MIGFINCLMETIAKTCVIPQIVNLESCKQMTVVSDASKLSPLYICAVNAYPAYDYEIARQYRSDVLFFIRAFEHSKVVRKDGHIITTLSFNCGNSDVDYVYTFSYFDYLRDCYASSYTSGATTRGSHTTFSDDYSPYDEFSGSAFGDSDFSDLEYSYSDSGMVNQSGFEQAYYVYSYSVIVFILIWLIPHVVMIFFRLTLTVCRDAMKNQSGSESGNGVIDIHLFVPVRHWSPQNDRLVFYNFRTFVGNYLTRRYDTNLDITVHVMNDRPHAVIDVTLEHSIGNDPILDEYIQHFDNFLAGLYEREFSHSPLDTFWQWNVFDNQSGRERKKDSRKEKSRRMTKKEKKDALTTFEEYPDYLEIRRGILNMDKLIVDESVLDEMTPVGLKKKILKIGRILTNVMSARERIDRRLDLPTINQNGDESRFSIDDIFGSDNQFTRAISLCINANCSHLSTGQSAKLLLQISFWSYELVTAESLFALLRKLTLLGTHVFPDVCSGLLESVVTSLFGTTVNQAGLESFASWTRELSKMWKDSNSQLVGQLKKLALIGAAGAVFGSSLESYSPLDILVHIIKPSQAEVDKTTPTDMITYFLECLKFMTQAAADAVTLRDPLIFFKLRNPETIVHDNMIEIMDFYNRFHTYGLSMLTISVEELRNKCIKTKDLLKTCQGSPKLGGLITTRTMFYNLDRIIAECDAGFKCKPLNEQPFVICAFGLPETGKSGVTTKAWQSIATANGYDCSPTQTCQMSFADKYQSTADGQRHVHIDDINQALGTKPDSINNSMLLLRMANQVPFFTNQAELGKKGNNVLAPKVITITSQTVHMYAHEDVHEPGAIHRRVTLYVEVIIKPEYATLGGSIDHSKLDGNADIQLLNVTKPVAVGVTTDGKQTIRHQYVEFDFQDGNGPIALHKITMKQFCHAAVHLYKEHMSRETKQLERLTTVDACQHAMPRECCYLCETNQSDGNVYLAAQKQLRGAFISYPKPTQVKKNKVRTLDEAAYAAEIADQEEEDNMENNAGFDMETLYYVALFVPRYLWSLPRLPVVVGPWYNPRHWYGNYVDSQWIGNTFGWKFKITFPAIFCSICTAIPLMLFAPWWTFFVPLGWYFSIPFVAHDMLLFKIRDWTSKQIMAFEARYRYLDWVSKNRAIAGMVAVVTGVVTFLTYRLITSKPKDEEDDKMINNGGNFSNLTSANATVKPVEWEKSVHITEYIKNSCNYTRQQLIGTTEEPGMILERTAFCIDEAKKSSNAFPICGNYWLFPLHYIEQVTGRIRFYRIGTTKNGTKFSWLPGPEGVQWVRLEHHDIALCFVADIPPQKDLRGLLSDKWSMTNTGVLLFKCIDYTTLEVSRNTIPVVFIGRGVSASSDDRTLKYDSVSYRLLGYQTRGGMCMSPVIGDQKHPFILGFHTKGAMDGGKADILNRSDVERGISRLSESLLTLKPVCSDEMRLVGGLSMDVHPKHVGRFVEDTEGVTFLGCAKGITRRAPKMHTTQTPIYDMVVNQFGIEDKWHKPPTKPVWLAHHKMMLNFSEPATPDPALVDRASKDYLQQLCDHFETHPKSLEGIRKMSLDEALIGVPGVPGYESLNMNTSKGHVGVLFPGYKNGGKKSEVLEVMYEDEEGKPCYKVTCPEKLLGELDELKSQAESLQRIGFVSALNYKDETLKKTKECARLFSALPLHFILLQRIYFLSFTKWFRDWNFVSECAVGINATSPLWHKFAEYMLVHSEDGGLHNVAGDYQAFDQKAVAMFLICCYNIILHICAMAGYTELDLNVMSVLMVDLIFPIFDFNGDLVMPNGGNPSGHSLTVVINSILNSLYMRYVFFSVLPDLIRFQAFVKLLTYGDDNIMSVHRSIREYFNQNVISTVLAEIGMVYTDTQKNKVFADFLPFNQVTFLKRSFVYMAEFGQYMAPIEMDSIMKSLLYHVPSKAEGVLVEHQMAQSLMSASDELFLHGKDVFEELQCKLVFIVANYGIGHYMVDRFYDGYEARVQRWHEIYDDQKFVEQSGLCDFVLQLEAGVCGQVVTSPCDNCQVQNLVSHDVRVRASSISPGFFNQRLRLSIGYLAILVALLLPQIVMALGDCKIMQLGRFVDSQYLSETNWVTEMHMDIGIKSLQANLDFADGTPQPLVSYNNNMSAETAATSTNDLGMGDFLSRPIRIASIPWTPALAGFGTSIDPWSLFFGNKRIINRINNYALMSANLHLKVVINGNGFYYGRVMMDYLPLSGYDTSTPRLTTSPLAITAGSQRLHLQIDPTTSSGGEMILPFIFMLDKISVASAQWNALGTLYFREMAMLRHANAATTPIEINVFAWAENVELSLPTSANSTALVNQSGDEYGMDKFMDKATALTKCADTWSDIPVVGPYARASSMVMRGVQNLAGLAGFSRPPDNDSEPIRKKILTNLVNTDANDGSVKLTVDSKQELSIGSESLNLSINDEMDLSVIAAKQAYIGSFYWDLTHAVDDPLLYTKVSPMLYNTESTPTNFMPSPMMFAALPFRFWRGKMKLRIEIVASSYHRGRLLVTWNPSTSASNELNVVMSTIIDLDKKRDAVIEIPWGLTTSFASVASPSLLDKGWLANPGVTAYTTDPVYDNGTIGVYVLNTLAVPNTAATSLVTGLIYVSMEDAEFAVPDDSVIGGVVYTNQSGVEPVLEVPMPIDVDATREMEHTAAPDTLMLTYIGERISSFRTLLKRYCYHMSTVLVPPSANTNILYNNRFPSYPTNQGTVVSGLYTGANNCRTTFITYVAPAYLAQRGGVRTKLYCVTTGATPMPQYLSAKRTRTTSYVNNTFTTATCFASEGVLNYTGIFHNVGHGAEITNPLLQNTLEVEVPFQRNTRFATAKDRGNFKTNTPVKECLEVQVVATMPATTERVILQHLVAAAEDFSLILFQGAPAFTLVAASSPT